MTIDTAGSLLKGIKGNGIISALEIGNPVITQSLSADLIIYLFVDITQDKDF